MGILFTLLWPICWSALTGFLVFDYTHMKVSESLWPNVNGLSMSVFLCPNTFQGGLKSGRQTFGQSAHCVSNEPLNTLVNAVKL